MFKKRTKKTFPAGTFLPFPERVLAIINLCLTFTLLIWCLANPFLSKYFDIKSKTLLYQFVIGESKSFENIDKNKNVLQSSLAERNYQKFKDLPFEKQKNLLNEFKNLHTPLQLNFFEKCAVAIRHLIEEVPPLKLSWIFFSIVITILALKKVEGAKEVIWILPAIAICYLISISFNQNEINSVKKEKDIFPSEKYLINRYLNGTLSSGIVQQRSELLRGWQLYLIEEWSGMKLSEEDLTNPIIFQKGVEEGEYRFTLARIELSKDLETNIKKREVESSVLVGMYVIWNLIFAFTIGRKKDNRKQHHPLQSLSENKI